MPTASASASTFGVRQRSTYLALREALCVGRAWRGAGAKRPVQNHAMAAAFITTPLRSALSKQAPLHFARARVGQFMEPRCARNASHAPATAPSSPRWVGELNTRTNSSEVVAPRLRSTVRPNPSLNADPLRQAVLPARRPWSMMRRAGKPSRLCGRRYLER